MTDFYDPFSHQQGDGRSRQPEVSEILPTLFVGLFAGVFVDRFNRKRILLASDLLRGLLVASIPFVFAQAGILGLYGVIFLAATGFFFGLAVVYVHACERLK